MAWKGISFDLSDQAVEHLVDRAPVRQLLHIVEPALDVRISRQVAADDFAERDQSRAEIVRDGDLVAAQILVVWSDPVIVEDLQPPLGVLLADLDGSRRLRSSLRRF